MRNLPYAKTLQSSQFKGGARSLLSRTLNAFVNLITDKIYEVTLYSVNEKYLVGIANDRHHL
jgi:hypothetical protein